MPVFAKARSYCTSFQKPQDFNDAMMAHTQKISRAYLYLAGGTTGKCSPAEETMLDQLLEATAALTLWQQARTNCATRIGIESGEFTNNAAVRQELDRMEALAVKDWQTNTQGRWEKKFGNKAEFDEAIQILSIVSMAYRVDKFDVPPHNPEHLLVVQPSEGDSVRVMEKMIDAELGRSK